MKSMKIATFSAPSGLHRNLLFGDMRFGAQVGLTGWSLPRRPKKRGPFQHTPVIFRAIVERLA